MAHLSVKSLLIVSFMLGSTAAGFAFKSFQQAAELASMAADLAQTNAALSASKKALKTLRLSIAHHPVGESPLRKRT